MSEYIITTDLIIKQAQAYGYEINLKPHVDRLPEIVRCRECSHLLTPSGLEAGYNIRLIGQPICNFWGPGCRTELDGFCAWGVRSC